MNEARDTTLVTYELNATVLFQADEKADRGKMQRVERANRFAGKGPRRPRHDLTHHVHDDPTGAGLGQQSVGG